jgi:hypothetical protein
MTDLTPTEVIREMRRIVHEAQTDPGSDVTLTTASKIHDWVNALEASMREPVMIARECGGSVAWIMDVLKPDAMHHRMHLYALPPDAEV